jgi:predicted nucleotidyltransferase
MLPIIETITKQISRYPSVEKVVLFGSRARGDEEERSDIDLAVVCPTATQKEWTAIWSDVDDARTLLSIDLVRLDKASDRIKESVMKEGIVLYERDKDTTGHDQLE